MELFLSFKSVQYNTEMILFEISMVLQELYQLFYGQTTF